MFIRSEAKEHKMYQSLRARLRVPSGPELSYVQKGAWQWSLAVGR